MPAMAPASSTLFRLGRRLLDGSYLHDRACRALAGLVRRDLLAACAHRVAPGLLVGVLYGKRKLDLVPVNLELLIGAVAELDEQTAGRAALVFRLDGELRRLSRLDGFGRVNRADFRPMTHLQADAERGSTPRCDEQQRSDSHEQPPCHLNS